MHEGVFGSFGYESHHAFGGKVSACGDEVIFGGEFGDDSFEPFFVVPAHGWGRV